MKFGQLIWIKWENCLTCVKVHSELERSLNTPKKRTWVTRHLKISSSDLLTRKSIPSQTWVKSSSSFVRNACLFRLTVVESKENWDTRLLTTFTRSVQTTSWFLAWKHFRESRSSWLSRYLANTTPSPRKSSSRQLWPTTSCWPTWSIWTPREFYSCSRLTLKTRVSTSRSLKLGLESCMERSQSKMTKSLGRSSLSSQRSVKDTSTSETTSSRFGTKSSNSIRRTRKSRDL